MDTSTLPHSLYTSPGFTLFDSAPVALSCTYLDEHNQPGPTHWNQAWLKTFGYAAEDVQGVWGQSFGLWPECEADCSFPLNALLTPETRAFTLDMFNAQREKRPVHISGHVVPIDGQAFLLLTYFDKKENSKTEGLSNYRTMVEYANDGILLVEHGRIVECNPAAERLLELTRNQLLQSDGLRLNGNTFGCTTANEHGSPDSIHHLNWQHARADGSLVDAEIALIPVRDQTQGGHPRFVGVIRDVGVSEFLCKRFGLQLTEMRSPN